MSARELSRKEVAFRLKCSPMQVARFEKEGRLHPRREKPIGQHGRIWYSVTEVVELAKTWKPRRTLPEKIDSKLIETNVRGKIASKVFLLLDEGATLREIVIECELDPLIVRQMFDEWQMDFETAKRTAERNRQAEIEREEQRHHDRLRSQEEWRKLQLKKIEFAKQIAEVEKKEKSA